MPKKQSQTVNIITPSNKLEIRSTTNAGGMPVAVGEDVLLSILIVLGQMKELLEEIKENTEPFDEEEEEY